MIMQDDRFSRLERLMQSFGGSVPQYCYENGIRTVVIVANEIDFFDNAEAIVLSFISFKLVKFSIVSQKAFEVQSIYPTIYSNLVFKELSEEDYKDCDLFLFLSGVSETEIEQKLQLKKIAYCSMPKILTIASEWLFYYRPLAFFATTHPKVPVLVFKTPAFPPENLQSENEKKIWADRKERFVHTRRKIEQAIRLNYDIDLPSFKGLGYSNTELVKILTQPTGYMDGNGIRQLVDSDNEFVTITGD